MPNPTKMYPASYLFSMVTELLRDLELPYQVSDIYSFGYLPRGEDAPNGGIWLEIITRSAEDAKIGTERIVRWIEPDIAYRDWGKPPTDYPVLVAEEPVVE